MYLTWLPKLITGCILIAAVLIQGANVVARYVFKSPFVWAEELLVFFMVWIIFIGAILVSVYKGHLRVDFVSTSFPPKVSKALRRATDLLTAIVGFGMGLSSLIFLLDIGRYGQKSVVLGIPMVFVHSVVMVSFVIIAVVHVLSLFRYKD